MVSHFFSSLVGSTEIFKISEKERGALSKFTTSIVKYWILKLLRPELSR